VHADTWKNPKHRAQWRSTLESYAYPLIGDLVVGDVDESHLLKVLQPIWRRIPETASRLRARIENVLGYAIASRFRHGDNPARWRGHLKTLLGGAQKDGEHFPALPFAEAPGFMAELRGQDGIGARALEFAILTAARTGDIIGGGRDEKPPMLWSHVKLHERIWNIPSTKTDAELRVPLSSEAIALLTNMRKQHPKDTIVFPGEKLHQPLSNMAMAAVIKRMNKKRVARGAPPFVDPKQNDAWITPHSFRSTFRDWAEERATAFPEFVIETALAHKVGDDVVKAYRRTDVFARRAKLMALWSTFLAKPAPTGATVTPLRKLANA
jgi:integrase